MVALNLTPKSLKHCFSFLHQSSLRWSSTSYIPGFPGERASSLWLRKTQISHSTGSGTHFTKWFLHKPKKRWHAPPKEFNFSLPSKAKKLDYLLHKTLCASGQNLLTKKLRGLRSYLNCTNELLQANCLKSNVHRIFGHHQSLC